MGFSKAFCPLTLGVASTLTQMDMAFSASVRLGGVLLAAVFGLGACGTTGDTVAKVKIFRLDPSVPRVMAGDPAIDFERRHYLHGALTAEEVAERTGNYYTVFWSVADRSAPVTLRFEYRQAKSGSQVRVIEQTVDRPKASNTTEFRVTGPAYAEQGKILAWRVRLTRGTETLATRESYLWR
jgi:hypothetical protein